MFYFRFAVKLTDFCLHSLRTEEDLDRCELHFKYLVFFLHNDSKITFVFPLNTLIYDYLIMIGHFQITTAYRWLKGTTKEEEGLARLSYIYRPFHKTLPRSSAFVKWSSVRFYETDCIYSFLLWRLQFMRLIQWFTINRFWNFDSEFNYSPFHKTLPKSSLQIHWISVKLYEMGDR